MLRSKLLAGKDTNNQTSEPYLHVPTSWYLNWLCALQSRPMARVLSGHFLIPSRHRSPPVAITKFTMHIGNEE